MVNEVRRFIVNCFVILNLQYYFLWINFCLFLIYSQIFEIVTNLATVVVYFHMYIYCYRKTIVSVRSSNGICICGRNYVFRTLNLLFCKYYMRLMHSVFTILQMEFKIVSYKRLNVSIFLSYLELVYFSYLHLLIKFCFFI